MLWPKLELIAYFGTTWQMPRLVRGAQERPKRKTDFKQGKETEIWNLNAPNSTSKMKSPR